MISERTRSLARLHLAIAHPLIAQREHTGLSVEALAESSGVSPDRILMIEEGDTRSLTEIAQRCEALGVGLRDVIPPMDDSPQRQEKPRSMVGAARDSTPGRTAA